MSSSNIIKLHNWRDQRVVIGLGNNTARVTSDGVHDNPLPSQLASSVSPAEVEEVLERARAEAAAIIAQAQTDSEALRIEAQKEGHACGFSQGQAAAQEEMMANTRRIGELARNASVDMASILNTLEEGVIELALSIAEKVINKHLAEDRSLVVSMVKAALEDIDAMDVIRIRVHPEDQETLRTHWDAGYFGAAGKNVEIFADPRVQVGGCVIDTQNSIVDAQVETKLAEIDKAIRIELEANLR